jgi:hypothetical protein
MAQQQKVIQAKVRSKELATQLGMVYQACKAMRHPRLAFVSLARQYG